MNRRYLKMVSVFALPFIQPGKSGVTRLDDFCEWTLAFGLRTKLLQIAIPF